MTVGFAPATANALLNALCRGSAYTPPAAIWVKLHVGDPGAAGTSNPATETTRKQATFGTNAAGGAIANTAPMTWTSVAGSEDYTHFTAWDSSSGGTFQFSGTVTANPVTASDDFVAGVGALTASIPVAS